jgi:hypothetical protein
MGLDPVAMRRTFDTACRTRWPGRMRFGTSSSHWPRWFAEMQFATGDIPQTQRCSATQIPATCSPGSATTRLTRIPE